MELMIVESPAKCKTIKKYLGDGWIVAASIGHIRDLPDKSLGYDPDTFKPQYEATKNGKKVISDLKKIIRKITLCMVSYRSRQRRRSNCLAS